MWHSAETWEKQNSADLIGPSWTWQWPSILTQAIVSNKIWALQDTEFIQFTDWRQTEEVANEVIAWLVLRDLSIVIELLKEFLLIVEPEGSSSSQNPVIGVSSQLIGSQFVSWYPFSLRYRILLSSQLHLFCFQETPFHEVLYHNFVSISFFCNTYYIFSHLIFKPWIKIIPPRAAQHK